MVLTSEDLLINYGVLLSVRQNRWQITDFGLTEQVPSRVARSTGFSRGSEGYRGPELLRERAVVCQQCDIFSLGCILYELAAGRALFPRDFSVYNYMLTKQRAPAPEGRMDARGQCYLREILGAMLELDWWKRPSARDILLEIGGQEDDWHESFLDRARHLKYPARGDKKWTEMKWLPYWFSRSELLLTGVK